MKPDTDNKNLFKVMQAIETAKLYDSYNEETNTVRIDSREEKEMYLLTRREFGDAAKKLKNKGIIKIDNLATDKNKHYERHSQLKPTPKFNAFYKKLQKEFLNLQDAPIPDKIIKCGNLQFNPKTGEFKYGKIKGVITMGTAPWSVLHCLIQNKNQPVTREQLKSAVLIGWRKSKGKKSGKSGENIDIMGVIKRIRRELKMGKVKDAVNKDIIHGGDDNKTYQITCK